MTPRAQKRPPTPFQRSVVAVLLTLVAPGVGHIALSSFVRGAIWIAGNIVLLAILGTPSVQGGVLIAMLVALRVAALGDLWLIGALDGFKNGRGEGSR